MATEEEILAQLAPGYPKCEASGCDKEGKHVLRSQQCGCTLFWCAVHRVQVAAVLPVTVARCETHKVEMLVGEWIDL